MPQYRARRYVTFAIAGLAAACVCPVLWADFQYTAVDIGTLGGSSTAGSAINNSGTIVGYSYTSGGEQHAFRYENGTMTDLGTLGGVFSFAFSVNESGVIVGYSDLPGGTALRAFKYENGAMTNLGSLGGAQSWASHITDGGLIVGASTATNTVLNVACRFTDTGPVPYYAVSNDGGCSSALDSGVVIGSYTSGGAGHGFLLNGSQLVDLGAPVNFNSSAADLNSARVVVGSHYATNGDVSESFRYHAGVKQTTLGAFGGLRSAANGINSQGAIVGFSTTPAGAERGYLHENGVDYDLNTLAELPAGVILRNGVAINDRGQIIAFGWNSRTYLLSPKQGGRLINLSVRGPAGVDERTLIGGFVIVGSGSKTVLIRAAGPSLEQFGVNFVPDPALTVLDGNGDSVATNEDWDVALEPTFAQVGAFPWTAGSKDAAIALSLPAGAYTVHVGHGDPSASQEALVEVYDVSQDEYSSLTNVSCRTSELPTNPIIVGATMDELGALLIRNCGPSLATLGVTTSAPDTRLAVLEKGDLVLSNDDWDPSLAETFATLGAFGFGSSRKDAAVFMRTPPAQITVHCTTGGASGVGLCELYTAP